LRGDRASAKPANIGGNVHTFAERAVQKPRDVKARLDEWVIGQERAKRSLTVAVYNHLKRIVLRQSNASAELEMSKSNILLLGPPGCGKTYLARTLARIINVPFVEVDATPLTQAGYVGEDVESIISKLLRAAGGDVQRAQSGIVYIDEVDKLACRRGQDRDVSGEGVQQGLLKILEGKRVLLRPQDSTGRTLGEAVEIDTADILFIGGGAFDGVTHSVLKRKQHPSGFLAGSAAGPSTDRSAGYADVTPQDLHRFGFLPEFVGRFPVLVAIDPLDETALVEILTRPRDALLKQYQRLFAMDSSALECTETGLRAIARAACRRKTGARGLRAVLEDLLLDVMFELSLHPGAFVLDEEAVEQGRPRRVSQAA
jgi:ATP-dependent Clp protease ATP-binding subunit ClpX